jgi:dihydrofolate synthase/folylpolyglutamate synthase
MPAPGTPLRDWLAWLETLSPTEINLGLDRTLEVLHRLDPARAEHVLLIAGTNGKGSSVAMTDALLRATGRRTGAYTSPHIHHYNERIVVDGVAVNDDVIVAAFEKVEQARGETELTYFEFGTLAAIEIFAEADLDVWILEVGLGGRLDATNAIEPSASLITNVSLDHCDWLGNDVETIAVEKAGVMRSGRPVVFGSEDVPQAVVQHAESLSADLRRAGQEFKSTRHEPGRWSWQGRSMRFDDLLVPGLPGEFQVTNAAAVLALLEAAGLSGDLNAETINAVLPNVAVAGRLERASIDGVEWIVDVAHNPAAAEALRSVLDENDPGGRIIAVIGVLNDKDVAGLIDPLADCVDRWIAVTPDSHRALPAAELARQISNRTDRACLISRSFDEAIEFVRRDSAENDRILATGSFFTVGPVLDRLAELSRLKT